MGCHRSVLIRAFASNPKRPLPILSYEQAKDLFRVLETDENPHILLPEIER